ncbi:membrane-associated protein, putative [Bodo saltans]|uniref:Membrane-associated protein, putative n=1 Tax=Bodo saltans TaxID=75058 RepID=A0A0S4KIS1_BODSA|nr:membrane-associated protein, putative [Bodo saltans]|eukprot:CUI14189.1 membrane-associated protein, putative [Bodo saltans]
MDLFHFFFFCNLSVRFPNVMRDMRSCVVCTAWVLSLLCLTLLPLRSGDAMTLPRYFYVNTSTGPTLAQCRAVCHNEVEGAYPATIFSAADNAAIVSIFPSTLNFRGVIGGTRFVGNNRSFRWVAGPVQSESNGLGRMFFTTQTSANGTCVPGVYCNFAMGEPNADGSHDTAEGQVEFSSVSGLWNDIPDGFPQLSGCICQRARALTPSRTTEVTRTLVTSEFWFVPGRSFVYNFSQCVSLCPLSRAGGFLATPTTEEECNRADAVVPWDFTSGFIGAQRTASDPLNFRWTTGPLGLLNHGTGVVLFTGLTASTGSCVVPEFFCAFRPGEPNSFGAGEPYVVVNGPSSGGGWNDDTTGEGCICQRILRTGELHPTQTLTLTISASVTISPSVTRTNTTTPPPTPTPSSSKSPMSPTKSPTKSHPTSSLQANVGVHFLNTSVSGAQLEAAGQASLGSDASFVVAELALVGTEFSSLFNWSERNCFANISDALVEMPMDGDAARTIRALIAATTIVRVTSDSHALVYLQTDAGVYGVLGRQVVIGVGILGECLARSYLTPHAELIIDATISNPTDSTILSTTGAVTAIVAAVNPVLAVQAQRNNIALAIQYCETSTGGIDVFRSPTTLAFGDSTVSAYVGGAAMNHVIVAGMIVVMLGIVGIRRLGVGGSWRDALTTIRSPGPLSFPILVLVEPTATCAVITILYAEGRLVVIGYISLFLCCLYPIVMLVYLVRGFKAERIQATTEADAVVDDVGSSRIEHFLFGKGKWIDADTKAGSFGFCRRNGHFFKEYRQGCHWFMAVEVGLGTLIGALEGIKLGYGQCDGVLYAVTVLLGVYLIAFFILRPCISPFANVYVVVLTALQLTGCVLLCFPRDHQRTSVATDLSAVGSYLVLIKSALDLCELTVFSFRSCKKWRDHREERRLSAAVLRAEIDGRSTFEVPAALLKQPISILARRSRERRSTFEVPAALLKQPISILARRSRELGANYPAVVDSGVLDLLDGGMYGRRGDVQAALEAVCVNNVVSMKRMAAHKEALDGVWRDWREEAMQVPVELVALTVQLREVEATMRASEASRVTVRGVVQASDTTTKNVQAALEAVCVNNVVSMKRVAAHKEALDGVWRDWREEAMQVPVELVALAVQLREVESTMRASEASRVTVRGVVQASDTTTKKRSITVKENDDDEELRMLEGYLDPMLLEEDDCFSDDSMDGVVTIKIQRDPPVLQPSMYGINSDGYLVVADDEAQIAKDDEYFPETDDL